ncbi:AmmeMemoRadiSam system radical SAM enzyme [Geomonas subterranea]|uniref:AmmeMemoRadiSam system radical SAM enzyme n=1 Tax=Geomonas subterranea TaxID=2847989 RepID=A0ABX8LRR9_9BACT|nr:AmmeMemoRadiSam system radical SAM enzyme [Geomonas subterranea]QXE92205.1 AmmeMemoRadiSam system radical SAM enzyme [Geomonas subterranea]QXM09696.1 AmmeMemoRadiSam system radical SAM enzyme [Geomonas subterranea]
MKEALFYQKLDGERVRCGLCRFGCLISSGQRGRCRVRENRKGVLYTLVYGNLVAEHVDPIEKKPLFHLLPGSRSYSVATVGCNFRCLHCQNYTIAQPDPGSVERSGTFVEPRTVVERALATGCRSIAYTYTEPTIFFEYAYETAQLAKAAGLKNIFVTNGYITSEALAAIAPYLDAANIDLKGFTESFYREVVGAALGEVLDCIRDYKRHGIWVELTTLVIPNRNDSETELRDLARFIASEVGVETPWHVTQFYPTHRLTDQPRTPVETLRSARRIGLEAGLRFVYEGNVPGEGGENSYCSFCGSLLIKRLGYLVEKNLLCNGTCPGCGAVIEGVWT